MRILEIGCSFHWLLVNQHAMLAVISFQYEY
jgi:hypothetical protein